jgi:hypothetical protein
MGYDSTPYTLVLADFNQDNTMDIVAITYGTSGLVILFNNGNGSFAIRGRASGGRCGRIPLGFSKIAFSHFKRKYY